MFSTLRTENSNGAFNVARKVGRLSMADLARIIRQYTGHVAGVGVFTRQYTGHVASVDVFVLGVRLRIGEYFS